MADDIVQVDRQTTVDTILHMPLDHWLSEADQLRRRMDIPETAEVLVQIPGGGDWSNELVPASVLGCVVKWTKRDG